VSGRRIIWGDEEEVGVGWSEEVTGVGVGMTAGGGADLGLRAMTRTTNKPNTSNRPPDRRRGSGILGPRAFGGVMTGGGRGEGDEEGGTGGSIQ